MAVRLCPISARPTAGRLPDSSTWAETTIAGAQPRAAIRRRSTTTPATWRCAAATPALTGGSSSLSPRRGSTAGRAARRRRPGRRGCAFSRPRPRRSGRAFGRASAASRTPRRAHRNGTVVPTSSVARCASIADGVVDRDGVPGLARRLGYSERHLNRLLIAEVGAGPLALARAQRAQTARILLETTRAACRRDRLRGRFFERAPVQRHDPGGLRPRADGAQGPCRSPGAGTSALRRPHPAPSRSGSPTGPRSSRPSSSGSSPPGRSPESRKATLARYRRTLSLPHGAGVAEVSVDAGAHGYLRCLLALEDVRDLTRGRPPAAPAVRSRCRSGRGRGGTRRRSRARPVSHGHAGSQDARARRRRRARRSGRSSANR